MSASDSSAAQQPTERTGVSEKAKGKQVEQQEGGGDMSMDDSEESGEDSGVEEVPEEADEDNMEEIDQSNILGGRTRGKIIDWQEAEQKSKDAGDEIVEDDDDEDDEDFVDEDDEMKD